MRAFSPVRRHLLAAAASATALSSAGAWAQAGYPDDRPINLVVGYSAGGAVDAVARTLGQALGASLGQPIIIDNRPGAGTNIAVKYVIGAKPDGHTLLMAANALAANMALYKPQPFDAETDLVAVSLVGRVPVVIAANANVPYRNIADLIAAAKAKPGTISFASPGNGSTPHMAAELFTHAAGIDLMHVPYKGGAQAVTDVASGQVPLIAMNALEVKPLVGSGRLKVLAVLSPERSPIFPDAPTIAESGFKGFESSVWYAVMAPAKTPMAIVERLHTEIQKALKLPEVRERMSAVGGEAMPGSRDMMVRLLHEERLRYAKLVREANIQPD